MVVLVTLLSAGRGSVGYVRSLLEAESWSRRIVLTSEFGRERFRVDADVVAVDLSLSPWDLRDEFVRVLRPLLVGVVEVALNFYSGVGDEHMALLSALLSLGLSVRLVVLRDSGVFEL